MQLPRNLDSILGAIYSRKVDGVLIKSGSTGYIQRGKRMRKHFTGKEGKRNVKLKLDFVSTTRRTTFQWLSG